MNGEAACCLLFPERVQDAACQWGNLWGSHGDGIWHCCLCCCECMKKIIWSGNGFKTTYAEGDDIYRQFLFNTENWTFKKKTIFFLTRKNNSFPLLALIPSQKSDSMFYLFLQIRNKFHATLKPLRTLLNLSRTSSQVHGGSQQWVGKACSERSLWVKVLSELFVLFRVKCFSLHLYSSFSEPEKSFLFLDETAPLHYTEFS